MTNQFWLNSPMFSLPGAKSKQITQRSLGTNQIGKQIAYSVLGLGSIWSGDLCKHQPIILRSPGP